MSACYWCESPGANDKYFYDLELRPFHPRCWGQVNGLGYEPAVKKTKEVPLKLETPPQEEVPQCWCKAGEFNPMCPYNSMT